MRLAVYPHEVAPKRPAFVRDTVSATQRAQAVKARIAYDAALGVTVAQKEVEPEPEDEPQQEIEVIETIETICSSERITSVAEIMRAVADISGYSVIDLVSSRRSRCLSNARFMVFLIARRHTLKALTEIARILNKDHTTVLHGVKRATKMEGECEEFRNAVARSTALALKREATKMESLGVYRVDQLLDSKACNDRQ